MPQVLLRLAQENAIVEISEADLTRQRSDLVGISDSDCRKGMLI